VAGSACARRAWTSYGADDPARVGGTARGIDHLGRRFVAEHRVTFVTHDDCERAAGH